jgi:hypothetical protein
MRGGRAVAIPFHGLVAATAALHACSETTPSSTVERTLLGDTVLVRHSAFGPADTAHLEPQVRYGRFAGGSDYEIGNITSTAVDARGDVFLYSIGEGIRQFRADGTFERWVAREGEGPREVGYAASLAATAAGNLAARDFGNRRIMEFAADGVVRSIRDPQGIPKLTEDDLAYALDGSLWVALRPSPPPEGLTFPRAAYARVDWERGLVDTIRIPDRFTKDCPSLTEPRYVAAMWEDKREPWFPKVKWARGPDGLLALGCSKTFAFDLVGGPNVVRVQRAWSPVTVSADERAFWTRYWAMPPVPSERPAYARLILPGDGRIWVWPEQPSHVEGLDESSAQFAGRSDAWRVGTSGAFDVFDYDGEWLGSVRLPSEFPYSGYPTTPRVVIRGDTVWGVTLDSLGVNYVTRYMVRWPQ